MPEIPPEILGEVADLSARWSVQHDDEKVLSIPVVSQEQAQHHEKSDERLDFRAPSLC